jgi:pimeloyl-ACP methyl ester carboxylesterase
LNTILQDGSRPIRSTLHAMTTLEPPTEVAPAPLPSAESAGAGDTVLLLIHGFPFTSAMWRLQIDALASDAGAQHRLRIVAPDLPGFGTTPGAFASVDEAADSIATVLDEIGARRVVLAGFSMGGYIAFAFMRKHPATRSGRLHGLILIDTKAEPDTEEGKQGRYALAEKAQDDGAAAAIDAILPRLVAGSTLSGRPDVVEQVRGAAAGATLEGVVGALRALAERPSSVQDLPRIAVPTLVIVGREDAVTPPSDAETMRAAIPGAQLTIIPDAGHMTPIEQPDAVNTAIRDWLAANITS